MKILFLHHEDDLTSALAGERRWERVIDVGFAGPAAYKRWSNALGCPVSQAPALEATDFCSIQEALSAGLGVLIDEHGLDWWDLIALEFHKQFEHIVRLRKLATILEPLDEVFVSQPGFDAQVLSLIVQCNVTCLSRANAPRRRLRRYAGAFSKLSRSQMLEIIGDKYDPGYRFRRLVSPRQKPCSRPVVLLPSAYGNVSKTELQYAEVLPGCDFLLVATRRSGLLPSAPQNVAIANLASYAVTNQNRTELYQLLERWNTLERQLMRDPLLSLALRTGVLDTFPKLLSDGLNIRDSWLQIFEREPVCAVLCADDANLPTRIPLMIAGQRGIPALSCHHGALDGRHRMRPAYDSIFLAKGEMERDYMVQTCGVSAKRVVIGAPATGTTTRPEFPHRRTIIFFSEPYEISGGRCAELYREILPGLIEIAASEQRELILKIHPMESRRERTEMARAALSSGQKNVVRVVDGRLTDELLAQAWFAVTVASTTAVDCTLAGIPVFLCQWLDSSPYAYAQQFAKFGAGIPLRSAAEIGKIPEMLEAWRRGPAKNLWQPISAERLGELLLGRGTLAAAI
jgi:hypothetical protein